MPTTETIRLDHSEPLDLPATLGCGQAFRWRPEEDGWWQGVVEGRRIRLRQRGHLLDYAGADEAFVRHYLALDLDLDRVLATFRRSRSMDAAIEYCYGLRILRQPLLECVISYLCATNTNIAAVQHRVEAIADTWGDPVPGGPTVHAFPAIQALCGATQDHFRACRLGYRAPYAYSAVRAISKHGSWEADMTSVSHAKARERLLSLPGIGPKAADCVLLYALGHLDAFPIDLWIRRILARLYRMEPGSGSLSRQQYEALRAFGRAEFGSFAGYAQAYLYGARILLCPVRPHPAESG